MGGYGPRYTSGENRCRPLCGVTIDILSEGFAPRGVPDPLSAS